MPFDKRKALQTALSYTQQGRLDKAITEYQSVLKADPNDLNVLNTLGDLYARTGNKAEAITQYMRLGDAYRKDGFAAKATAVYRRKCTARTCTPNRAWWGKPNSSSSSSRSSAAGPGT
ncbi:MAG: tetratricopeptide repeat protein [candidate division NC10 bacterium]|nr:tetratricopeptide repeat protein [candidate division NC10 bacterium]